MGEMVLRERQKSKKSQQRRCRRLKHYNFYWKYYLENNLQKTSITIEIGTVFSSDLRDMEEVKE
jgi:hypothetical protein